MVKNLEKSRFLTKTWPETRRQKCLEKSRFFDQNQEFSIFRPWSDLVCMVKVRPLFVSKMVKNDIFDKIITSSPLKIGFTLHFSHGDDPRQFRSCHFGARPFSGRGGILSAKNRAGILNQPLWFPRLEFRRSHPVYMETFPGRKRRPFSWFFWSRQPTLQEVFDHFFENRQNRSKNRVFDFRKNDQKIEVKPPFFLRPGPKIARRSDKFHSIYCITFWPASGKQ